MPWDKLDFTFKKLLNKRVTSENKKFYEEVSDYTLNVHATEIWAENIPGTPPNSSTSIIEVVDKLTLTKDTTVSGSQAWYAFRSGERLKDWIPDKFDGTTAATYAVQIFDQDNNPISVADTSNLIFDYQTGILLLDSTHPTATSFKISGYRYIGTKGVANSTGVVNGTGNSNFIPLWSDSNTISNSIMTQTGTTIINIVGTLRATTKSFDIPHPTKSNHRLVYGCLEGPENGVYIRGKASGKNLVTVNLPEYWSKLCDDFNVVITPLKNQNLFISSQTENTFTVQRCGMVFFRKKSIDFSYLVIGSRRDAPLVTEYELK